AVVAAQPAAGVSRQESSRLTVDPGRRLVYGGSAHPERAPTEDERASHPPAPAVRRAPAYPGGRHAPAPTLVPPTARAARGALLPHRGGARRGPPPRGRLRPGPAGPRRPLPRARGGPGDPDPPAVLRPDRPAPLAGGGGRLHRRPPRGCL